MPKIALKGLRGLRLWPIVANTKTAYEAGEKMDLPGLQTLTKERQGQEFTIWADDDIYDTGDEYQSENITIGLTELPLEIEAELAGGNYDEETKTYTFKKTDTPPEFALGYAAPRKDNGFRMFKHFAVKLLSVGVEHKSGEGTGAIHPYTLNLRNTARLIDGAVRDTHDEDTEDYTWLDTIPTLPQQPAPPQG